MRIAFYNLTSTVKLGGVETCSWELARELAGRGHLVDMIGGTGDIREDRGVPGIEVHTFPFTSREKLPDLGSRFRKLGERMSLAKSALSFMTAQRYAAIVVVKPYDIPPMLWVRRRSGARVCYFSGGGEFFPGYGFFAKRLDHFCACSAYDAGDIAAHKGVRPAVNHYGVDTKSFRPMEPDAEWAARWGVDPDGPVMASAVRLVAFKGLDVALRALALARKDIPGLRYLLAGSGPEEEKLKRICGELGLENTVTFTGPLPHAGLPRFYSLARVGLFPSREKEALGIAVGEAMACGLAALVTRVGGMPEQATPGTGLVVEPKSPEDLARGMRELFADPESLAAKGRAARQRMKEHFSWAACADRLLTGLGLE